MATMHITPTGSGKKDGSSVDNAAGFWQIDKMIEKAGAGGTVLLHADMGAYSIKDALKIMHGGTDGQPVTIKGVDALGNPKDIEIVGTRAAEYSPTGAKGTDIFRLLDGADNLKFENMSFKNVQNAFRVGDDVSNISVSHMEADNVQRFFENYASNSSGKASISGLLIEDVDIHGFSKGAVRLQYDTNNVIIRNVTADSERQDGDNFAIGVHLGGTVHDVLIKNTSMMNATDTIHSYWNGDGFATEAQVYNVRFEDTYAAGNTDGGYDLKSDNTVLLRAVAEDNNRNFRIWGDGVTMIDSESIDPNHRGGTGGQAHVHLSTGSKLTIIGSTLVDKGTSGAIFDLTEKDADITLIDTDVYMNAGGKLTKLAWGSSVTNADGTPIKVLAFDQNVADAMKLAISTKSGAFAAVPTTFDISPETSSVTEGDAGAARVSFTVSRSGDASKSADIDWAVEGFGENAANGADFLNGTLPLGHLQFAAGERTKTITVEVRSDKLFEANETFKVVLTGATNGTINVGSADVVINNDDAKPKVVTILDKAHAIDLSSSANQTVTGAAYHNSYYVDAAVNSGKDVVTAFGRDDVLLTTKALYDGNGDGIIKFSKTSTVAIDGVGSKDTITLTGDTDGLRLLGKTDAGLFVYANSDVRPVGAVEGKLSDDVLMGSGNIKKPTTFFFDTGLDLDFGHDTIKKFGAKDLFVTTSEIASVNGKIAVDQSGYFALPGGHGGPDDTYIAGEGGHVAIFDVGGVAVTTLEHDGAVTHDGVTYHVYSMVGSSVGVGDLLL